MPRSTSWRRRVAGIAAGTTVLFALFALVTGAAGASASSRAKLTWAPPRCGDATHKCKDITLTNTGSNQAPSLDPSTDYRIHLPKNGPLVGGLQIDGGRNVQVIGGEIDLSTPCDDSKTSCHGINISRSNGGEVYVEGVYIKNPDPTHSKYTGDGIDVDDDPGGPDIVLQNIRIEGIDGCDESGDSAAHADVFQPYNAGGANLLVDHLTGTTDCQGMQVDPDYAYQHFQKMPKSGVFKNVNINILPNPHTGKSNRYAWWLTYNLSCPTYPITLVNDYTLEPDGTMASDSVWPDTNQPSSCASAWHAQSRTLSFVHGTPIHGNLKSGRPAGGDFVSRGAAGLNYRSPGYQHRRSR